jgi:hypothetical protein
VEDEIPVHARAAVGGRWWLVGVMGRAVIPYKPRTTYSTRTTGRRPLIRVLP